MLPIQKRDTLSWQEDFMLQYPGAPAPRPLPPRTSICHMENTFKIGKSPPVSIYFRPMAPLERQWPGDTGHYDLRRGGRCVLWLAEPDSIQPLIGGLVRERVKAGTNRLERSQCARPSRCREWPLPRRYRARTCRDGCHAENPARQEEARPGRRPVRAWPRHQKHSPQREEQALPATLPGSQALTARSRPRSTAA
jgi:hypothetical protein